MQITMNMFTFEYGHQVVGSEKLQTGFNIEVDTNRLDEREVYGNKI